MKSENQRFGELLIHAVRAPGSGTRMQSASTGSSVAGGDTGTSGEASSRPDADGTTRREWLMGDPWTDPIYYFCDWKPLIAAEEL